MLSQFSAAPDPDDLAEQLPGEVDSERGHGLDGPMRNPIMCCGTLHTTARSFWRHFYDNHDDE